ncbi:MAG: hypothetical protein ACOYW9_05295 [Deinococcota bacterium]
MTFLALLTLLLFALFAAVLVYFLTAIARTLEAIGSREPSTVGHRSAYPSYLARIALGVSAIEKELSALGPQATRLNESLGKLVDGLKALKASVGGSIKAVERQGGA